MSDFQRGGRGQGRGRGQDRGGGRGGRGGSEFGGRGGGYRGDRGGGRGDRGGGRGDRGDRGGFRGRGGRGGYDGGRNDGPAVWGTGQVIPSPDPAVTTLEDEFMRNTGSEVTRLATQMGKLSVTGGGSGGGGSSKAAQPGDYLPCRPAFGDRGKEVVVWANYFALKVNIKSLLKYTVEVFPIKDKSVKDGGGKSGPSSSDAPPELKSKKMRGTIIQLALNSFKPRPVCATEARSQVVSLQPLKLPQDGSIVVQHNDGRRVEGFRVKFNGPTNVGVEDLMQYLTTMKDPADQQDQKFPKFEDAIDALGLVVGHTARTSSAVACVGKGKFLPLDQRSEILSLGWDSFLEVIRGYFQSVRPATGRLLLNTNVSHSVVRRSGNLAVIMNEMGLAQMHVVKNLNFGELRRLYSKLRALSSLLKRTRVRLYIFNEKNERVVIERSIGGLANRYDTDARGGGKNPIFMPRDDKTTFEFGGPEMVKFYLKEGDTPIQWKGAPLPVNAYCKVSQYHQNRYGKRLDPKLPLVNVGDRKKPRYYSAEDIEIIPGQDARVKLSASEAKNMINFACRLPYPNAQSITTLGRKVLNLDDNALLENFGVAVEKGLITVKARELPCPKVEYRGSRQARVMGGSWNMADVKVVAPGRRIKYWSWVHVHVGNRNASDGELKDAVKDFTEFLAGKMGINIEPMSMYPTGIAVDLPVDRTSSQTRDTLRKGFRTMKTKPELVFVLLPSKDTDIYNAVKTLADTEYGFHTVCMVQANILKRNPGNHANVGLKVNLKFGGVNHRLGGNISDVLKEGKTMVVGWDVIHPTNLASDAENLPSQVGLVASIDQHLAQWPAVAWNQDSRVEMLNDKLKGHFQDRLQLWGKHNKAQLPDNIIIFRDGVSEGQFRQVHDIELPLVREACKETYGARKAPRITLIISVKRHQTRFYPTSDSTMSRSTNVNPGTVVDRGVTLARYWDFFLTAHAAIKGTARPARYTVLVDEIFRATKGSQAANELEKLTHDICYLFGRATKAVSICPPAYYADIVCTRARAHASDAFDPGSSAASAVSGQGGQDSRTALERRVHDSIKDDMYYI